ncbi:unnamed protein product [Ixodes persulcatus]
MNDDCCDVVLFSADDCSNAVQSICCGLVKRSTGAVYNPSGARAVLWASGVRRMTRGHSSALRPSSEDIRGPHPC